MTQLIHRMAALAVTAAALAAPNLAEAQTRGAPVYERGGHGGEGVVAGAIAGLAIGALAGTALSAGAYAPPAYYAYPPAYVYPPSYPYAAYDPYYPPVAYGYGYYARPYRSYRHEFFGRGHGYR